MVGTTYLVPCTLYIVLVRCTLYLAPCTYIRTIVTFWVTIALLSYLYIYLYRQYKVHMYIVRVLPIVQAHTWYIVQVVYKYIVHLVVALLCTYTHTCSRASDVSVRVTVSFVLLVTIVTGIVLYQRLGYTTQEGTQYIPVHMLVISPSLSSLAPGTRHPTLFRPPTRVIHQ